MPVLLALLLAAAPPLDEEPAFQEGLAAFKELRLEEAALAFQRAALDDTRPAHERARVQMWMGATYGQLGQLDRARSAFAFAFALTPDAMLPVRVSPKVMAVLEEERKKAVDRRAAERAAAEAKETAAPPPATTTPMPSPSPSPSPPAQQPAPVAAAPAATTPAPASTEPAAEEKKGLNGWLVTGGAISALGVVGGLVLAGPPALVSLGFWSGAQDPAATQADVAEAKLVADITATSAWIGAGLAGAVVVAGIGMMSLAAFGE